MSTFNFNQITITSKNFYKNYQTIDKVDLKKIMVSKGVTSNNNNDLRYIIGYQVGEGVIPFFIKTPKGCSSNGVTRYSDSSPWKMGFNTSGDEEWQKKWIDIWWRINELINAPGCGLEVGGLLNGHPLNNEKYLNPKLVTWDTEIKTRFLDGFGVPQDAPFAKWCEAVGVIKIASVYRHGVNQYLQLFLKESKYSIKESNFESQLSNDSG